MTRRAPIEREEVTWRSVNLPMAKVKDILGAREVATILKMSEPAGYCRGRAKGWWDANEPEYYAAYTSLVKLIARGEAK